MRENLEFEQVYAVSEVVVNGVRADDCFRLIYDTQCDKVI